MGTSKKFWFSSDPQIVIDNENDEEFAIVDLEFGWIMKGHSFYVRPMLGVGADRPADYSVEIGYKVVGW